MSGSTTRSIKTTDQKGGQHVVIEAQETIVTKTLSGVQRTPGLKSYRLANGNPVNFVSDTEYYDVFGDRKLIVVQ